MQTDFLIIGSGLAGLTYALKIAEAFPDKEVTVITKSFLEDTNTAYAQGGVATVWDFENDSFEKHISDTLVAGDGLCDEELVASIISEGPERLKELIAYGTQFDKDPDGDYSLGREGGHSENRILHHKDITGREIERAIAAKARNTKNIRILEKHYVIDIITQHHFGYLVTKSTTDITCYGVYMLNEKNNTVEKCLAPTTVLATGGCGQAYRTTTNPRVATGDGVAMVYRAKGRVENMEFIQFHPTALFEAGISPSFLITEAVRGDGGILRNHKGEAFMEKYDERKDLAPRDIVARAIDNEMKQEGKEYVYLDCRHMDYEKFLHHFPNINEKCLSLNIDIRKDMIPVAPAAHYSCGGIKVDGHGRTTILNLYACGECSSTGLHGANRLASNSLLEAMVYGHRVYEHVRRYMQNGGYKSFRESMSHNEVPDWISKSTTDPKEMILITQSRKELELTMSDYVGIVRNNVRLERAMKRLDLLFEETEQLFRTTKVSPQLCELRNLISVAYLIVKGAQFRKESRGLHFNTDYPEKSNIVQDIIL